MDRAYRYLAGAAVLIAAGAVQAGELGSNADTRALARLLNTTVQGLAVKGKAGVPPAQLTDVVRTLLSFLQS